MATAEKEKTLKIYLLKESNSEKVKQELSKLRETYAPIISTLMEEGYLSYLYLKSKQENKSMEEVSDFEKRSETYMEYIEHMSKSEDFRNDMGYDVFPTPEGVAVIIRDGGLISMDGESQLAIELQKLFPVRNDVTSEEYNEVVMRVVDAVERGKVRDLGDGIFMERDPEDYGVEIYDVYEQMEYRMDFWMHKMMDEDDYDTRIQEYLSYFQDIEEGTLRGIIEDEGE